jgi:hypothetical protein
MLCIPYEEQSAVALCCVFQNRNNLLVTSCCVFQQRNICCRRMLCISTEEQSACRLMLCISTEEQSAVALCHVFQQRNNLLVALCCVGISAEEQPAVALCCLFNRGAISSLSPYVVYCNRVTISWRLMLCISTEGQSPVALCCAIYVISWKFIIRNNQQPSSYVYFYYFTIRLVYFDEEIIDFHWFLFITIFRNNIWPSILFR